MKSNTKDLADAIGRDSPQADVTAAFEDFVNGEVTLEYEIPAVFDLRQGIKAR